MKDSDYQNSRWIILSSFYSLFHIVTLKNLQNDSLYAPVAWKKSRCKKCALHTRIFVQSVVHNVCWCVKIRLHMLNTHQSMNQNQWNLWLWCASVSKVTIGHTSFLWWIQFSPRQFPSVHSMLVFWHLYFTWQCGDMLEFVVCLLSVLL